MRMHRLLVSLLTVALIGLVPVGFASSAEAAAKPRRDISATGQVKNGKVYIKGKVTGTRAKMIIQRRAGRSGPWRGFSTIRANGQGKYQFRAPGPARVGQKALCYRIVMPGNGRFRKTYQAKFTYPQGLKKKGICVIKRRI